MPGDDLPDPFAGLFPAVLPPEQRVSVRSEEHTSELQSLRHLVCRLLLEKKKQIPNRRNTAAIDIVQQQNRSTVDPHALLNTPVTTNRMANGHPPYTPPQFPVTHDLPTTL